MSKLPFYLSLLLVALLSRRAGLWAQTEAPAEPATAPEIRPALPPAPDGPVNTIAGVLHSTTPITKIVAVYRISADPERVTKQSKDDFIYPGTWDAKTEAFSVPNLLPGRTYDLIVWNGLGRWEGITMDYHRPIILDKPMVPEDRAWMENFIVNTPSFYDKNRILWMAADHRHATVLVELQRTRDFYSGGSGDVIYRTELWYFENLFGGWAKDKNTEKVMVRWRGKGGEFPKFWQFLPQLGGIALSGAGRTPQLTLALADQGDPKRGVVHGLTGH